VTECTEQIGLFSIGRRKVTIESNGTYITSNAGVLLASWVERRLEVARRLSAVLHDERNLAWVTHTYETQIRQRLLQIVCGYEGCNDATEFAIGAGLSDGDGTGSVEKSRPWPRSRPCRGLNSMRDRSCCGCRKCWWTCGSTNPWPVDRRPGRVVLEFDSTDDPTHGAQQLTMFHGYYDQHMYHRCWCSMRKDGLGRWC